MQQNQGEVVLWHPEVRANNNAQLVYNRQLLKHKGHFKPSWVFPRTKICTPNVFIDTQDTLLYILVPHYLICSCVRANQTTQGGSSVI